MEKYQQDLCPFNTTILASSPQKNCMTACTPLSHSCSEAEETLTASYSPQVLCNELLDTMDDNSCECQVFWAGDDCSTHYVDMFPTASNVYSIFFALVFLFLSCFSAREIYKHMTELDESAQVRNDE
jgi:hypothetical protein